MRSFPTFLLLTLLLLVADLCTATTDRAIMEELQSFIKDQVEPNIERYLQFKRQAADYSIIGPDCLDYKAGRLLRHRCCVVYSNLAAAILFGTYGAPKPSDNEHSDLKTLREYHATRQKDYQPQELDVLLKMWAINNVERNGIYRAPLQLLGVNLSLSKCEFSDTHTFLVLTRQDTLQELVVDMSWKQVFLMSILDEAMSNDHERKETASENLSHLLKEEEDFLVFAQDQPPELFSFDSMKTILQQGNVWDATNFSQQHKLLLQMYSNQFSKMICGKTTAEIEEEQRQLAMLR